MYACFPSLCVQIFGSYLVGPKNRPWFGLHHRRTQSGLDMRFVQERDDRTLSSAVRDFKKKFCRPTLDGRDSMFTGAKPANTEDDVHNVILVARLRYICIPYIWFLCSDVWRRTRYQRPPSTTLHVENAGAGRGYDGSGWSSETEWRDEPIGSDSQPPHGEDQLKLGCSPSAPSRMSQMRGVHIM